MTEFETEKELMDEIAMKLADAVLPVFQGNTATGHPIVAVKLSGQPCFNLILKPVKKDKIKLIFEDYLPNEDSDLIPDEEYMAVPDQKKNKQLIKLLQIINPYLVK